MKKITLLVAFNKKNRALHSVPQYGVGHLVPSPTRPVQKSLPVPAKKSTRPYKKVNPSLEYNVHQARGSGSDERGNSHSVWTALSELHYLSG